MSTRAKFLVETMVNVRNGKTKGLGAERDDVARMRRFLSGLGKKRRLLAPEPLRVGLQDLLNADARGRWWIVGAGWSGNPLVEKAAELAAAGKPVKEKKTDREDEEVLLELARKQGMNTDVRRSVFVVLLTSEDYVHACDRLDAFRLTDVQQREFVRVTLHCCGMVRWRGRVVLTRNRRRRITRTTPLCSTISVRTATTTGSRCSTHCGTCCESCTTAV